jgi:hypothetical protein
MAAEVCELLAVRWSPSRGRTTGYPRSPASHATWLVIVAPLAGGLLGALVHRALFSGSAQIAPGESAVEAGG